MRGQPGGRHRHVPHRFRLRRDGRHDRRLRRRAARLLRRALPRRRDRRRASPPPTTRSSPAARPQFASGGSFSEVLNFAAANDARPGHRSVVEGRTPIDALIVKPGTAESLEDLAGTTIGVKGKLPASVAAMLASAGLVEGEDYDDGAPRRIRPGRPHRPRRHRRVPRLQEQRTRHARPRRHRVRPVRPDRLRHPGFVRGELHEPRVPRRAPDGGPGLRAGDRCAVSPTRSPTPTPRRRWRWSSSTAGGNPNYLSPEGEAFRWQTESALLQESYGDGEPFGVPIARPAPGRGRRLRRGRAVRRPIRRRSPTSPPSTSSPRSTTTGSRSSGPADPGLVSKLRRAQRSPHGRVTDAR